MASLQLPNCKKKSAAHKNGFEVLVYCLYSKIRFSAALSSRNIAICTTRSTMCAVSDYERYEQVLTVVSVPQWRHCRAAVSPAITTTTTSTGNMVRTSLACTGPGAQRRLSP